MHKIYNNKKAMLEHLKLLAVMPIVLDFEALAPICANSIDVMHVNKLEIIHRGGDHVTVRVDGEQSVQVPTANLPLETLQEVYKRVTVEIIAHRVWCPEPLRAALYGLINPVEILNRTSTVLHELIVEDSAFKDWIETDPFRGHGEDAIQYVGSNGDWSFFTPTKVEDGYLEDKEVGMFSADEIPELNCLWILLCYYTSDVFMLGSSADWMHAGLHGLEALIFTPGTTLEYSSFYHGDENGDSTEATPRNGEIEVVLDDGQILLSWVDLHNDDREPSFINPVSVDFASFVPVTSKS